MACRRPEKLGQEIEAGRLAGPIGADQRMNTAASHLERNIANGEKTRELLGQSLGFENELIGQTKFPHQPSSRGPPRTRLIFYLPGRFFPVRLGTRPGLPPPGRNKPTMSRSR